MKKGRTKGKYIKIITVVKARFTTTCAEEGCENVIEKGQPCHARRPGEEYFCASSAAKQPYWPRLDKNEFINPLKASKQGIKRKHREEEPTEAQAAAPKTEKSSRADGDKKDENKNE